MQTVSLVIRYTPNIGYLEVLRFQDRRLSPNTCTIQNMAKTKEYLNKTVSEMEMYIYSFPPFIANPAVFAVSNPDIAYSRFFSYRGGRH